MSDDDELETLSYREAAAELEALLVGFEADEVDVDGLAERVARAAALIRLCRARIQGAQVEIERIVSELEHDDAVTDGDR